MKALNLILQFLLFLLLFSLHKAVAEGVTPEEAKQLRDEVKKINFSSLVYYLNSGFLRYK